MVANAFIAKLTVADRFPESRRRGQLVGHGGNRCRKVSTDGDRAGSPSIQEGAGRHTLLFSEGSGGGNSLFLHPPFHFLRIFLRSMPSILASSSPAAPCQHSSHGGKTDPSKTFAESRQAFIEALRGLACHISQPGQRQVHITFIESSGHCQAPCP